MNLRRLGLAVWLAAGVVAGGGAATARAQGTGRSLDIDTSIRAAGMGGANCAVFWGEPGLWGNPAATALVQGARYEYGRTRLVPGLSSRVILSSGRLLLGGGGIGVTMMGRPFSGLGRTRLDYGLSQGTDASGNPTGVFDSHEDIEADGAGLALARSFDAIAAACGHQTSLSRFAELAAGVQHKHLEMLLAPGVGGETDAFDWGWQARISPFQLAPEPLRNRVGFDFSFARSVLNSNGTRVDLPGFGSAPTPRLRRRGIAVRGVVRAPWEDRVGPGLRGLWRSGFAPFVTLGWAGDREHISTAESIETNTYDVERNGAEITLLGFATYRFGHVTDRLGDVDGDTSGWGLAIPLGNIIAVRFDAARIPQARDSGLPDVKRSGWSGSFDPLTLWRYTHAH